MALGKFLKQADKDHEEIWDKLSLLTEQQGLLDMYASLNEFLQAPLKGSPRHMSVRPCNEQLQIDRIRKAGRSHDELKIENVFTFSNEDLSRPDYLFIY